ncbi:APC family permease, partial [Streptomyces sp. NPDC001508]|uniref:APC family permease n=1 Tax=Streptomyces sp. NPDC001508 TaxID=3154656 RepID=UPI00331FA8DA
PDRRFPCSRSPAAPPDRRFPCSRSPAAPPDRRFPCSRSPAAPPDRRTRLPRVFEKVSPRTATPVAGTLVVAVVFALPAAFAPLDAVMNLCTIGTLAVMAVVNIAVIALRRREPGLARTFRVPLHPVLPLLGVGFCLYLMYETGRRTWIQFAVFLGVGLLAYLGYGCRHSTLAGAARAEVTPDATDAARQAV